MDARHPGQQWIVQPLVEAGLHPEAIRTLVFRLGFEAVVSEGRLSPAGIRAVVADQAPAVRAAWLEVTGRMIAAPPGAPGHAPLPLSAAAPRAPFPEER